MIRAIALGLGLILGLSAAAVLQGRMAHWRALADPPVWTEGVRDDAGLLSGQADGPAGSILRWRFAGIDADGPDWRLGIDGAGLALDFEGRLAGRALALSAGRGTAVLSGPRLAGHFALIQADGQISEDGLSLRLTALGRQVRLDGAELPDGRAELTLTPQDGWTLELAGQRLSGDALADLLQAQPWRDPVGTTPETE